MAARSTPHPRLAIVASPAGDHRVVRAVGACVIEARRHGIALVGVITDGPVVALPPLDDVRKFRHHAATSHATPGQVRSAGPAAGGNVAAELRARHADAAVLIGWCRPVGDALAAACTLVAVGALGTRPPEGGALVDERDLARRLVTVGARSTSVVADVLNGPSMGRRLAERTACLAADVAPWPFGIGPMGAILQSHGDLLPAVALDALRALHRGALRGNGGVITDTHWAGVA